MDPATGTFTTMDTYGGSLSDPMSLHKYLFANSNPVMYCDPSGHYTLTQQETAIAIQAIIGEAMSGIFYIADWLLTDPESQNHSIPMMIITMMTGLLQGAVMGSWGGLLTGLISKAGLSILDYLLTGIMFTLFSWDLKLAAMNMKESGNWLVAVLCDAGGDFAGVVAFASIYNGIAKGWNALTERNNKNTNNKRGYIYLGDNQSRKVGDGQSKVYRVLRYDENPANGLTARNPSREMSVEGHIITGSRNNGSQYISTTTDINVARYYAAKDGCVIVEINLNKLPANVNVYDLSTDLGRNMYLKGVTEKNFAKSSSEVLLEGYIPSEALRVVT